ncbi:hypothetical protein Leryth_016057 [Lithospermum erythrorhizon]|nr:hypothetical protein Leryth_016057 [Lithospermum erythrorhizon]
MGALGCNIGRQSNKRKKEQHKYTSTLVGLVITGSWMIEKCTSLPERGEFGRKYRSAHGARCPNRGFHVKCELTIS